MITFSTASCGIHDQYVALLRKVNVGGKNLIKMDTLRGAFEAAGF
jgi:uncharacterized protein (DUF1697 family)